MNSSGFTPYHFSTGQSSKGFTLIEVTLSLALIAIIAGFAVPVYISLRSQNELDVAATAVVNAERRAQVLARASEGDSDWGVSLEGGFITLYKGASYSERDTSYDETFDLPQSVTPSGEQEIVFAKYTGFPDAAWIITLTSRDGSVRDITTNEKGTITY